MYYLTLMEAESTGAPGRSLGRIEIKQERLSKKLEVVSYSLESQGHRVGTIAGWRVWQGPWRLAQAALNTVYGGLEAARDCHVKNDGQCNAQSIRDRRCRYKAREGSFYCDLHDPLDVKPAH